jgi:hypothetical protein
MLGLDILHRVPALGATAFPFLPTVARSVRDLQKRMERAGLEIEEVFKPVPGFALVVARKSGLRLPTRTPHRLRSSGYSRSVGPLAMIPPNPLQIISVV